jgi:acyl-CoA thioester hydrolase
METGESPRSPHVEPIQVRWGDMDSMGHVNNARYFTYCESARMGYFQAVRMEDHFAGGRFGPALAAAQLNFRQQVRWPAAIEVETRVIAIGRSSFTMDYTLIRVADRVTVADGSGVIVWVDYSTGRPTPLPDGLRETIRRFEGMET